MRQLSNSPIFGLTLITLLVLLAILAPLLTVHNPFSTNVDGCGLSREHLVQPFRAGYF